MEGWLPQRCAESSTYRRQKTSQPAATVGKDPESPAAAEFIGAAGERYYFYQTTLAGVQRWQGRSPAGTQKHQPFINQLRGGARLVWLTVADCRSACHAGGVAFRAGPNPSWKVPPGCPPLALIVPGSVARSRCERLRPGRPIYPGHRLRLLVATTINSRISSAVKACIEQSCRGTADEVADR